ncbi:unnamed protein product [Bursaphelenchus okinawaensis]|uniref:Uncharacterized protein n=1 Tax=Bursaphelenchus okinawaensis TaxID=465554 RepID=A0A811LLJ0_9BILA|nr:unnamed protein product [Bursaphelenchus okinawaensis]CAG9123640.1 unnamed protein product [Bursaphelenchus okinawaensis]
MNSNLTPIEYLESDFVSFLYFFLYNNQKFQSDEYNDLPTSFSWRKLSSLVLDFEKQNAKSLEGAILALDQQLDYVSYVEILNQFKSYYTSTSEDTIKSKALLAIAIIGFGRIYLGYYFNCRNLEHLAEHNLEFILAFTRKHIMDLFPSVEEWAKFNEFVEKYAVAPYDSMLDRVCLIIDRLAIPMAGILFGYIMYRIKIA